MGIIISQYKDPYKPMIIMECHKGFVAAAHLVACFSNGNSKKFSIKGKFFLGRRDGGCFGGGSGSLLGYNPNISIYIPFISRL